MIDFVTGAKIAAPIVGGLLGRNDPPSQATLNKRQLTQTRKMERRRYTWMRQGAEAAGYNPSSVLGAVGGNFANVNPLQAASPMNTGRLIGDAIYNFADAMDPVRAETERLNNELLKAEIDLTKRRAQTAASPFGGVPSVQTTQSPVTSPYALKTRGTAFGFPTMAQTALGGSVPLKSVATEAVDQRVVDEGLKNAYGIGGPSWWPTSGYMEEFGGDDSWLTNSHKRLNPLVLGANYLYPEATEAFGHGVKKAFDEWWFQDPETETPEEASPMTQNPPVPWSRTKGRK
ncbi:hypothetical protein [Microviridae sp.]|nr:hypothetical protein [Microviridae sp.]